MKFDKRASWSQQFLFAHAQLSVQAHTQTARGMAALLVALALHPPKARSPVLHASIRELRHEEEFRCLLPQAYPRAAPGEARISVHPEPVRKGSIGEPRRCHVGCAWNITRSFGGRGCDSLCLSKARGVSCRVPFELVEPGESKQSQISAESPVLAGSHEAAHMPRSPT